MLMARQDTMSRVSQAAMRLDDLESCDPATRIRGLEDLKVKHALEAELAEVMHQVFLKPQAFVSVGLKVSNPRRVVHPSSRLI
jgi:hypothetical protein